jgi:spectinomycin phosphotransferase
VRAEPGDIGRADLAEALLLGWGIVAASCDYVPVGGGSYHWRAVDGESRTYWVTAYIAAATGLRASLATAIALRDGGNLEFVVAPIRTPAGEALRPLGSGYAVALYPYLEAEPLTFGRRLDDPRAVELAGQLARLHGADVSLASGLREVAAEVRGQPELERALGELETPWQGGPFSEPARQALGRHQRGIRELLHLFDELAHTAEAAEPVTTHGEPHPANLLLAGGRLLVIDWDTVALSSPERDVWWLDGHPAALKVYEQAAGRSLDPVRMRLYRVRWTLDDIASFVQMFRSPHERNPDTERWWSFAARLTLAAENAARPRPARHGSR